MYEFMERCVVQTAFILLITVDVWWVIYLIRKLVKWIWKKIHKADTTDVEETAAPAETE